MFVVKRFRISRFWLVLCLAKLFAWLKVMGWNKILFPARSLSLHRLGNETGILSQRIEQRSLFYDLNDFALVSCMTPYPQAKDTEEIARIRNPYCRGAPEEMFKLRNLLRMGPWWLEQTVEIFVLIKPRIFYLRDNGNGICEYFWK